MKIYQHILFDLDGTLTDPGEGITRAVRYALEKCGCRAPEKEALYSFIGPPLMESFERFCGFTGPQAQTAVNYYREYYKDQGIFENVPYPGVAELLRLLQSRGKNLLVATSKPEVFAIRILDHFGLSGHFSFVAGSNLDGSRVKKAEVIEHALALGGIADRKSTLMIGDREHDILGAKTAEIDVLGVLYGYGSREELIRAGAVNLAETVEAIADFIG